MAAGTLGDGSIGGGTLGSSDSSTGTSGFAVATTQPPRAFGAGAGGVTAGRVAGATPAPRATSLGITAVSAPVTGIAAGKTPAPKAIAFGAGPIAVGFAVGKTPPPRAYGTGAGGSTTGRVAGATPAPRATSLGITAVSAPVSGTAAGKTSAPKAIAIGTGGRTGGRAAAAAARPTGIGIGTVAALPPGGLDIGWALATTPPPGAQAMGWLGLPVDSEARVVQIGGSTIPRFPEPKDPSDVVDYQFDVSALLSPDDLVVKVNLATVATANLGNVAQTGQRDLVVLAALGVGQSVVVWLGQGQPGWRYQVSVGFVTQDGRRFRRSGYVSVASL